MRCIVTGGAGFIGSHISNQLIVNGHNVMVVDNFSSGKQENIPDGAKLCEADINDFESLKPLVDYQPEAIVHLAAQISVRKSVENPVFDGQTNILGTVHLAQIGLECNVKKFIFTSTGGAIYGEQSQFPATEDHPVCPESPYGLSKYCAEQYLDYLHRKESLNYIVLRFANIYGPRQDPHGEAGVVAIFTKRMLANNTPRINGDGEQTRDFVYVEDAAQAAVETLESPVQKGVFNIGTGIETNINTLALEIQKHAKYQGDIVHGPAMPGEQRRSVICSDLAKTTFDWAPNTSLSTGLAKTVDWFRK